MTPEQLADANQRLAGPPEFDPSNSARLGLLVVGILAARHGVRVTLRPSPYGGVTAIVLIPPGLVIAGTPEGAATVDGAEAGSGAPAVGAAVASPGPLGGGPVAGGDRSAPRPPRSPERVLAAVPGGGSDRRGTTPTRIPAQRRQLGGLRGTDDHRRGADTFGRTDPGRGGPGGPGDTGPRHEAPVAPAVPDDTTGPRHGADDTGVPAYEPAPAPAAPPVGLSPVVQAAGTHPAGGVPAGTHAAGTHPAGMHPAGGIPAGGVPNGGVPVERVSAEAAPVERPRPDAAGAAPANPARDAPAWTGPTRDSAIRSNVVLPAPAAEPPAAEPLPADSDPALDETLPRRRRQTNLPPQLANAPAAPPQPFRSSVDVADLVYPAYRVPEEVVPQTRTPDQIRAMMSSLQAGTVRGRRDAADLPDTGPAESGAVDTGPDGTGDRPATGRTDPEGDAQ
jgi:hypothetical protein